MSELKPPDPVKPIAAVFSADRSAIGRAASRLEDILGPLDYAGAVAQFNQTEYYRPEMGWPLFKRFLSAEKLIDPVELVDIKHQCADYERETARDGRRTVNVDPGYVSMLNVVLATGKRAAHRIYLGRGVWADLSLVYQNGRFCALDWTYPDYASDEALAAMSDIRQRYLDQLKNEKKEEI